MAADNINLMPEDLRQKETKSKSGAPEPELRVPQNKEEEIDLSNLSGGHASWMTKFADRLHKQDVEKNSAVDTVAQAEPVQVPVAVPVPEVAPVQTSVKVPEKVEERKENVSLPKAPLANGFELQDSTVEKIDGQFHQPEKSMHARFIDTAEGVDLVPSSSKVKTWKQISSFSLFALVGAIGVVVVFYFGFLTMSARLSSSENTTTKNITEIETKLLSFEAISQEINAVGKEVQIIYDALAKHVYWTQFFALLEKYTLANVSYGSFAAGGNSALTLNATAPDYYTVARQLKVLQDEQAKEFVSGVNISSATLSDAGVSFTIELTLNSALFYYEEIKE